MILSDRDLKRLIQEKEIVSPFDPSTCEGATVDLTLDKVVKRYRSKKPIILGEEIKEDQYEEIDIEETDFELEPHQSVLVNTVEVVKIPDDLTGRVYERSSVKYLGLMISPAHYMNPGYRGSITLLMVNHSSAPIRLVPGIKICQLSLHGMSSASEKPYSKQDAKYMDSRGPSISKLHLDKDIQDFLSKKGVPSVSDELVKELGEHLMSHIRNSAKRLADIIREEEGK